MALAPPEPDAGMFEGVTLLRSLIEQIICPRTDRMPLEAPVEEIGGDYVAIQLASLDDMDPQELLAAPIRYADGRNNDWGKVPEETRHL